VRAGRGRFSFALHRECGSALSRHHAMVKGQQCVCDLDSQASHSPKLLRGRMLYCQSSGVRTPVIGASRCSRLDPGSKRKNGKIAVSGSTYKGTRDGSFNCHVGGRGFEPRCPRHLNQSLPDNLRWCLSAFIRQCYSSCYSLQRTLLWYLRNCGSASRRLRPGESVPGAGLLDRICHQNGVSLILPSSIPSKSSSAVEGYQRCPIANSLPGAHNRLIANNVATRDHGTSAGSSSTNRSKNRSSARRLHNSRPR